MAGLEETMAVGAGVPVKKVTLESSIGSFIYIHSGNSPMRDSQGTKETPAEPHELVAIGSRSPKILVIPDYFQQRTNAPSEPPLISPAIAAQSGSTGTAGRASEATTNDPPALRSSPSISSKPQVNSLNNLQKSNSRDGAARFSSSTPLNEFDGIDKTVVEILESEAKIRTVGDLAALQTISPSVYEFIKDAKLVRDIDLLIARALSVTTPSSTSTIPGKAVKESVAMEESRRSFGASASPLATVKDVAEATQEDMDDEAAQLPLEVIAGLQKGSKARLYLERNAYVRTVGDLAVFPRAFPGIYTIMNESGVVDRLNEFIARAQELVKSTPSPFRDLSASSSEKLSDSRNARSPRSMDVTLAESWLQSAVNTKQLLRVLVKPSFWAEPDLYNAPVFALVGLDEKDAHVFADDVSFPVLTIADLAGLPHHPTRYGRLKAEVPMVDEFVAHAQKIAKIVA